MRMCTQVSHDELHHPWTSHVDSQGKVCLMVTFRSNTNCESMVCFAVCVVCMCCVACAVR